jgi:hypothetical protein
MMMMIIIIMGNWRKQLSILVESGPGPDNFKLNINKSIFLKYKVTDPQRSSTTDRKLKPENTGEGPKNQKI